MSIVKELSLLVQVHQSIEKGFEDYLGGSNEMAERSRNHK